MTTKNELQNFEEEFFKKSGKKKHGKISHKMMSCHGI